MQKLANALTSWGVTAWFDTALLGGTDFRNKIEAELSRSKCVIVCWSQKSIGSAWVIAEAEHAMKEEKIVPILLDACMPPKPFNIFHTINMSGWDGENESDHFIRLLQAVSSKLNRSDVLDAAHNLSDSRASLQQSEGLPVDIAVPRSQMFTFRDMRDLLDTVRPAVQSFDPDVMVCFDARGGIWAELLMDCMSYRIPILIGFRLLKKGVRKTENVFGHFPLIESSRWDLYVPPLLLDIPAETRVLFVDDYSQTGETCCLFRQYAENEAGIPASNIQTMTLITTPEAERLKQLPDIYGVNTKVPPRLFYMSIR